MLTSLNRDESPKKFSGSRKTFLDRKFVLHRLTNDSSLAWSVAEHTPDHPRCLCSLTAVDARCHPTQRAERRGAIDVYSRYTSSLSRRKWIEMPASFVVTFCRRRDSDHVFQSPSQITVDRYRLLLQQAYRYRRRHANRYIVFADTVKQWVNIHRYAVSV